MGWAMLAIIGGGAALLLWRLGVPRLLWTLAGAALMLGATGYALQGSPALPGKVARPQVRTLEIEPDLVELRNAMFGRFSIDAAYQTAADAMIRANEPAAAVKVTLGGLDKLPNSAALWTELGSTLVTHDGDTMSPPALFAFRRAMRLAPRHPGPPFFLGLGYVQAGQLPEARKWWARALQLTPPGLSYRAAIAERLALLDQFMQMAAAAQAQGSQPPPQPRPTPAR